MRGGGGSTISEPGLMMRQPGPIGFSSHLISFHLSLSLSVYLYASLYLALSVLS